MTDTMKAKELHRLLNNTPSPAHADVRIRLQGFIEAIEPFELRHLQRAVTMILGDQVPDLDPRFPIYPGALVHVCKQLRDRELTHEATHKAAVRQIVDRSAEFHKDPPEVRKAAVAAGLARLSALNKPEETPEQVAIREAQTKAYLSKHDAMFVDPSPAAMARRLHLPHVQQHDGRQERQFTQDPD